MMMVCHKCLDMTWGAQGGVLAGIRQNGYVKNKKSGKGVVECTDRGAQDTPGRQSKKKEHVHAHPTNYTLRQLATF